MTEIIENSVDESKSLHNIYAALGHAIRYDIINFLGTFHRPVHYTELVEWLQIRPGSFYFHIKKLKGLIEQDSEKRFFLTTTGQLALEVIKSGETIRSKSTISVDQKNKEEVSPPKRFSIIFFGEFVRRSAFNNQFKLVVILTVLVQVLLLYISKLGTIPFYLDGDLYFGFLECAIELLASFLIIWFLLEIIIRFYSPIKNFSSELLTGIPLAMVPLFVYPLLVILADRILILGQIVSNPALSLGVIFFLQVMTAIFLIQLLQVIKSVNFENALVPVFMVLYGFSILSFIISNLSI
ncbi:MAG: winged helix-turn-helix domain-containing protein [Candidatus Thorarchaeota archaeon]